MERMCLQQVPSITWTNLVQISYCSFPETCYRSVQIDPFHKRCLNLNNNTYTSLASHSCEESFIWKHQYEAKDVQIIVSYSNIGAISAKGLRLLVWIEGCLNWDVCSITWSWTVLYHMFIWWYKKLECLWHCEIIPRNKSS